MRWLKYIYEITAVISCDEFSRVMLIINIRLLAVIVKNNEGR